MIRSLINGGSFIFLNGIVFQEKKGMLKNCPGKNLFCGLVYYVLSG